MAHIDRLPGPADGADGLRELAELFGDEQAFQLIRLCRLDKGEGNRPGAEVLTELGNRMVAGHMDDKNVDYDTARQDVATRLGYAKSSWTNFYKILTGTARRTLRRRAGQ